MSAPCPDKETPAQGRGSLKVVAGGTLPFNSFVRILLKERALRGASCPVSPPCPDKEARCGAGVKSLLLPLASLRIARHTGVQECRERVSNRLRDLSPGLSDVTFKKRIAGVVFSS